MDENQFMVDLWDVLSGNDEYCTLEQFRARYDELRVDMDEDTHGRPCIRFMDDNNEWHLTFLKVWSDNV